jgi:hypothetical protein
MSDVTVIMDNYDDLILCLIYLMDAFQYKFLEEGLQLLIPVQLFYYLNTSFVVSKNLRGVGLYIYSPTRLHGTVLN